jgi:hypothetical protein
MLQKQIDNTAYIMAVSQLRRSVAGISQQRNGFALGSVHVEFVADKCHWGRFRPSPSGFHLSTSLYRRSSYVFVYQMGDEQQACWWLQFRDITSPHRHETRQARILRHVPVSSMLVVDHFCVKQGLLWPNTN